MEICDNPYDLGVQKIGNLWESMMFLRKRKDNVDVRKMRKMRKMQCNAMMGIEEWYRSHEEIEAGDIQQGQKWWRKWMDREEDECEREGIGNE